MVGMQSKQSPLETGLSMATLYLVFYNLLQFIGWTAVMTTFCSHVLQHESLEGAFAAVATLLYIVQTAGILEVVHAAVGLVRSNPILTAFQISSRVFLIWGVCFLVPQVQNGYSIALFIPAWCITEMIRYPFYAANLLDVTPPILVWLRYTLFIVLYPIGVTGELWTVWNSLPYVARSGILAYPLPNPFNVSFDYYVTLILIMLTYFPVFPQLYMHMFHQRNKLYGSRPKVE